MSRSWRSTVERSTNSHQRDPAGDQIAHRRVAGLLPQLARVEPGGLDRDEGLRHELLVVGEGALGRLHPGRVAVEGEDDLAGERVGVHEQPAQYRRCARRRTPCRRWPPPSARRPGGGHDVGVALDDHRAVLPGDLALGQVDAVEQLALLVDRRLGRVEVLGLDRVVVEQPPSAEARRRRRPGRGSARAAGGGSGRSASRAIDWRDSPPATSSAALKPAAEQGLGERVPARRRVPAAEGRRGRVVEAALLEERPGDRGLRSGQLLGVERRRARRAPRRAGPAARAVGSVPGPRRSAAGLRAAAASRSTASPKLTCSIRSTNRMTSPPTPHPKQWNRPRAGDTDSDGDFSSWNGQSPLRLPPPALRSATCSPMTSAIGDRSRTAATSSSRMRPATR